MDTKDWLIVSHVESPYMDEGSIIFEMQEAYWQLEADPHKIREVVNMPMVQRPGSPTQVLEELKALKRDLIIGMVLRNDSEE